MINGPLRVVNGHMQDADEKMPVNGQAAMRRSLVLSHKGSQEAYLGDVHRHVQGADDSGVAVGQAILDVVQRRVHQHPVVVPSRRLRHSTCWKVSFARSKSLQELRFAPNMALVR